MDAASQTGMKSARLDDAVCVVATNTNPRKPQVTKYQIVNSAWSLAWAVSTRHARMYTSR